MKVKKTDYDFTRVHENIQSYIDRDLLASVSSVVIKDNEVIDFKCFGFADAESGRQTAEDTIYRIYSNTKIVTSVAAMCLYEDGCFGLDDNLADYLPQLGGLSVLRPDGDGVTDVEPMVHQPTVRQLMCHNAGFSYGFLMESPVDQLYTECEIMNPTATLAEMIDKLANIPLANQPGSRWQYSVSTDILARLVEVWSGQSFDDFLKKRIFTPLAMPDTGFWVPAENHGRLATNYAPVNPLKPMEGGLVVAPDSLVGGYLESKAFTSGGGGLVSTIGDYTRFIQMLIGDGTYDDVTILEPETVGLMHQNMLPVGIGVQLPNWFMPDTVFGLGLAIKTAPAAGEPDSAIDEFHWGGMAGTHSWIAPRANLAGLIFTQRLPGFWHPFSHDFKRLVYAATA